MEKGIKPANSNPSDAVGIVDAMAVIQGISTAPRAFGELAELIFAIVTRPVQHGARRIDFVCDQYSSVSIEVVERGRRGNSGSLS